MGSSVARSSRSARRPVPTEAFASFPPAPPSACAAVGTEGARDHRQPATVLAVLPPRAGFRRPFATRARSWMVRPNAIHAGYPTRWPTWTRRLSSTSAIRTVHEHNHEIVRSPALVMPPLRAQLALVMEASLLMGLGPHPRVGRRIRVTPVLPRLPSLSAREEHPTGTSRGFTGQGPAGLRRPTPLVTHRAQFGGRLGSARSVVRKQTR